MKRSCIANADERVYHGRHECKTLAPKYDPYHSQKIFKEKEQELASELSFEKTLKENSPTQGRTKQGKHSTKDRKMLPLSYDKNKKIMTR